MNDGTWYWLLGGSAVVLLGGLGYASYKAVPGYLEREAPELLPYYQGVLSAPDFAARQALVLQMLEQLGGDTTTPPLRGTIEGWHIDGSEILGHVRDMQGVPDDADIAISPLRVTGGVAYTPRSAYRLGEPDARERRHVARNLFPIN